MPTHLVYTPSYTYHGLGLDHLHPFDIRKHRRAFTRLRTSLGPLLRDRWLRPAAPLTRDDLLAVHTPEYLDSLRHSRTIAQIVEVPQLAVLPAVLLDRCLLRPMRWAAAGTLLAARTALTHDCGVINLSGGYHHASSARGEGFCVYDDIILAVRLLRRSGELPGEQGGRIIYIDLDAHQGNGVARDAMDDRSVFILDMYNASIYPNDPDARRRIDCNLPLRAGARGDTYLATLREDLPTFLDAAHRPGVPPLAIYNAGTDPYEADALGGLNLSFDDILERDRVVLTELHQRRIPWIMLPSGGYSRDSYRMIAATTEWAITQLR